MTQCSHSAYRVAGGEGGTPAYTPQFRRRHLPPGLAKGQAPADSRNRVHSVRLATYFALTGFGQDPVSIPLTLFIIKGIL